MPKRSTAVDAHTVEMRARVLAEPARRRVWETVRRHPGSIGVAQLAAVLEVHPNTVRLHLSRLVEAGLVTEELESERHPGRPGYRYRAAGSDAVSEAAAYRRLAELLAHAVRAGVGARDAGRSAGAAAAARLAGQDPVVAVASSLADEGFVPEVIEQGDDRVEIVLHSCPFADAAAEDPATICQLHLGLAEGAVQAIGGLRVEGLRINDPHQAGCRVELRRTIQTVPRA